MTLHDDLQTVVAEADRLQSDLDSALKKITELQAALDKALAPPTPAPSKWALLKDFDLTANGGLWTGIPWINNRDGASNSMASAKFGTGPNKKGLTIEARRTGPTSYSAADIFTQGKFNVPNYFRAEVVGKVGPLVSGMWPGLLWFRPDGPGEGEIDVVEQYGREALGARLVHHTIHKTPYTVGIHAQRGHQATYASLGDTTGGEAMHTYVIEKIPGQITMSVDGKVTGLFKRADDVAWWDSIMEVPTQKWYPRITFQIGPGKNADHAGPVPASWTASDLYVDSLKFWNYNG